MAVVSNCGVMGTSVAHMLVYTLGMRVVRVRVVIPIQIYVLLHCKAASDLVTSVPPSAILGSFLWL